jgi:hypothetical protein
MVGLSQSLTSNIDVEWLIEKGWGNNESASWRYCQMNTKPSWISHPSHIVSPSVERPRLSKMGTEKNRWIVHSRVAYLHDHKGGIHDCAKTHTILLLHMLHLYKVGLYTQEHTPSCLGSHPLVLYTNRQYTKTRKPSNLSSSIIVTALYFYGYPSVLFRLRLLFPYNYGSLHTLWTTPSGWKNVHP